MFQKICLATILFAFCFEATSAITCYQCNSEYDPRCGDPFDPYSLGKVNCSMKGHLEHLPGIEPEICRKTTQKINGKIRVVRGCGYVADEKEDQNCIKRSGTYEVQSFFCSCTTDECNGTQFIRPHHLLITATLPIIVICYNTIFISIQNIFS